MNFGIRHKTLDFFSLTPNTLLTPEPRLIETLATARAVTVLTGAGVSAESGIPTFRDALIGLWAKFDPAALATSEAFHRDPELVSRWYDQRRRRTLECQPNDAHLALARWQKRLAECGRQLTLITQNVDRLHQRAGSKAVIELHGTLLVWRCTGCQTERLEEGGPFNEYPPACQGCGRPRRPAVVWFGETLAPEAMAAAEAAIGECDLFVSVGTSAVVQPATGLIELAIRRGAATLEINLDPTPISNRVDFALYGCAGKILPQLV